MTQTEILALLNSGAFDKFLSLFGKNKEESKQVIVDNLTTISILQEKVEELNKKLDVILKYLDIELVKQEYVIKKK